MTDINHSEVFTDLAHHKVHEEALFFASDVGVNIQAAVPKLWYLLTGAKEVHLVFNVQSDGACKVEILEGSTVTVVGTPVTPLNKNRRSVKTPLTLLYKDPTVTVDATVLETNYLGTSGLLSIKGSGENSRADEYVLKPSSKYVIKVTVGVNGTNASIKCPFYEA